MRKVKPAGCASFSVFGYHISASFWVPFREAPSILGPAQARHGTLGSPPTQLWSSRSVPFRGPSVPASPKILPVYLQRFGAQFSFQGGKPSAIAKNHMVKIIGDLMFAKIRVFLVPRFFFSCLRKDEGWLRPSNVWPGLLWQAPGS